MNSYPEESLEAKVAAVAAKYHHDQQGRMPETIKVYFHDEMVIVYTSGVYTATEEKLRESEEGRKLIKSARRELRSLTRREIEHRMAVALGRPILRSFWDLDNRSAEQIEVYMFGPSE